jgi:sterol-4alpha-carboxylate 3-dehydrogenase (decarboxylating)
MAPKPNSYLVVGGCGCLGHMIVSQLLETHSGDVAVLDLRTDRNRLPGAKYFDGDITSASAVNSVLEQFKPTVLFHTVSPLAIQNNKPLFDKVNIEGTQNLIDCAGKSGYVKAFVYTSSSSVIHDTISDLNMADESYPVLKWPQSREYYSHTKGVAEGIVLAANRKYGDMLTCAIRPSGIFGEGDVQILPNLLSVYRAGRNNVQLGDNKNYFDYTYVGNVAHAHLLAAKALLQTLSMNITPLDHERVDGEAFFVTNGEPMPFWSFAQLAWKTAGWKGSSKDIWVMPRALGMFLATILEWIYWIIYFGKKEPLFKVQAVRYSTMNRTFNIDKARKRLGYQPLVSIAEGVSRGVKDWEKRNLVEEKKSK